MADLDQIPWEYDSLVWAVALNAEAHRHAMKLRAERLDVLDAVNRFYDRHINDDSKRPPDRAWNAARARVRGVDPGPFPARIMDPTVAVYG